MICQQCGTEFRDGAKFCPSCGTPVAVDAEMSFNQFEAAETPFNDPIPAAPAAPEYTYPAPRVEAAAPAANPESGTVLTWGILALVFANIPYITFLGIIFGAIGMSKANAFIARYGVWDGKSKTGSILAKIGLILGIVETVIYFIVILVVIFAVLADL